MSGCEDSVVISVLLATVTAFSYTSGTSIGDECELQFLGKGICTWSVECPYVTRQLEEHYGSVIEKLLLQHYYCGSIGSTPLYCCPPPSLIREENSLSDFNGKTHINIDLLPMDECGKSTPPPTNSEGSETGLLEFPWMVMLFRSTDPEYGWKLYQVCSGTLINNRYVLTSARCVSKLGANIVRVGEHDLREERECDVVRGKGIEVEICYPPAEDIFVEKSIVHPEYNWETTDSSPNDIALLRLSKNITFHETVRPICLPIGLEQQIADIVGKDVEVVGWGRTKQGMPSSVLQKFDARVLESETCDCRLNDNSPKDDPSPICVSGDFISDYGSPLSYVITVEGSKRTMQRGIYSSGHETRIENNNSQVFIDVGHYMKWILDHMEP